MEKGVRLSHPYHNTTATINPALLAIMQNSLNFIFYAKIDHMFDNCRIRKETYFLGAFDFHLKYDIIIS